MALSVRKLEFNQPRNWCFWWIFLASLPLTPPTPLRHYDDSGGRHRHVSGPWNLCTLILGVKNWKITSNDIVFSTKIDLSNLSLLFFNLVILHRLLFFCFYFLMISANILFKFQFLSSFLNVFIWDTNVFYQNKQWYVWLLTPIFGTKSAI